MGKLNIPLPAATYINEKRLAHKIGIIDLTISNIEPLESLPDVHKDPFDRLLISQAIDLNLKLVTDDKLLLQYPFPDLFQF